MKTRTPIIAVVCGASIHAIATAQNNAAPSPDREAPIKSVNASDLITKVPVIGALGVPLWKVTRVRGAWRGHPREKDSALTFLITQIDGRRIEKPIEFRDVRPISEDGLKNSQLDGITWDWRATSRGSEDPPAPAADQEWELVVVETGQTFGYSDEVFKEALEYVQWPGPRGFITSLKYMRMRRIR
jgi:hypothetical protein